MLFQSTAHSLIRQVAQGAALSASSARKEATAKRLAFYHDEQLEYLANAIAEHFAEPERLTPCFINIVRKVIDRRAMTYMEPATRTVEGREKDQATFSDIAKQCGLDVKLKQASRLTKLCKTILIRPVWRNGCMDIDLLCGNILDVETGESPEDLQSILITHYGASDKVDDVNYSLWTPESVQTLNYRGQVVAEEENPYQILPFIPAWDRSPTDSFWLSGGNDLVGQQEAVNYQLTSLLYTAQMQGFGVGYVKGGAGGDTLSAGPGTLVELGDDGELGFAATKAPIAEIVAAIDTLIKWSAVSNGLPASSLSTDPTEESGVSKLVSNAELEEKRRDDIALWRGYEHKLFDTIRTVWNTHNPTRTISDSATLKVDFSDPQHFTTPKEQTENWEKLLGLGVISQVDIALERNPDLKTREDALAYLLQLQQEQSELGETAI